MNAPSRNRPRARRRPRDAGAVLACILLGGPLPASAQGPEPQPPTAAGEATKEKKAPQPQPDLEFTATAGFQDLNRRGSAAEYFRHHSPPQGLYASLVRLLRRDPGGFPLQEVWWRNAGEADQKGYVDLHVRNAPSYLRYSRETAEFFADPGVPFSPFSSREESRVRLHLERFEGKPTPTLDVQVRDQDVAYPFLKRLLPDRGINYRAQEYSIRGTAPVGPGRLYLEPRVISFDNRVGRQQDSHTLELNGELAHPVGRRADLAATFEQISTEVGARDTAVWTTVGLRGVARPTDRLVVEALYRGQTVGLPFTRTSFADRTDLGLVQATAYPFRRGSVTAGVFHQAVSREDRDGAGSTDSSSWNGGLLRVRCSDPGLWSFSARVRFQELADAPAFPRLDTLRAESLYYTQDLSGKARLDLFPTQRLSLYADYGHRTRRNQERDTRVTMNAVTAGAVAQLSDRLTFSAEFSQQFWDGSTAPLRTGPGTPVGAIPLRFYFSDGSLITSSLAYQVDRRSVLDLSFNNFIASGGQRSRDTLALLHFRRNVSPVFYYGIGVQIEGFRESRPDRDYHALPLLLEVGYRRRFK